MALDSPRTLVIAFGASRSAQVCEAIRDLVRHFPRSHVVGCSTAGEIYGTEICDDSLAVAVTRFAHTELRVVAADVASADGSYDAGQRIARELMRDATPRAMFVLSSGVQVNGSELVRGINALTHGDVVVTGGLAGDGQRFECSWILDRDELRSARISAVGFYGSALQVGFGSKGGWDLFGSERRITRARGNVLYELDGAPALTIYKRYLGERASGLPATALLFPLALRDPHGSRWLVRTVLSVSEREQSLTFAGDVPEGSIVQLMRANFERLIDGAAEAALSCKRGVRAGGPALAVAVSCVGRRLVLGERSEEEVEVVRDALPEGASLLGFYSYGELSPLGGPCELHNQTMTVTTFAES